MKKSITNFKALFNPYTRELLVKYKDYYELIQFEETDEWGVVWSGGVHESNEYLHIHLHYDEVMQLIVYQRSLNSSDYETSKAEIWNSRDGNSGGNIRVVNSDLEWDHLLVEHMEIAEEDDFYRKTKMKVSREEQGVSINNHAKYLTDVLGIEHKEEFLGRVQTLIEETEGEMLISETIGVVERLFDRKELLYMIAVNIHADRNAHILFDAVRRALRRSVMNNKNLK